MKGIDKTKKIWEERKKQKWWKCFEVVDPVINGYIETVSTPVNGVYEEIISDGDSILDMKIAIAEAFTKQIETIFDDFYKSLIREEGPSIEKEWPLEDWEHASLKDIKKQYARLYRKYLSVKK